MVIFSKEILNRLSDVDYHSQFETIEFSTSPREIVTISYMVEHPLN
jgi:hypothetical protein